MRRDVYLYVSVCPSYYVAFSLLKATAIIKITRYEFRVLNNYEINLSKITLTKNCYNLDKQQEITRNKRLTAYLRYCQNSCVRCEYFYELKDVCIVCMVYEAAFCT